MKYGKILVALALVCSLTACEKAAADTANVTEQSTTAETESVTTTQAATVETTMAAVDEVVTEITTVAEIPVETTTLTESTVVEAEAVVAESTPLYSDFVVSTAKVFATALMNKLSESTDEFDFAPISSDPAYVGMGLESIITLIDTDFDGVPELFAGTAGTIGAGRYDIFKADGTVIGRDILCCSDLGSGCVVDGALYMFSGRNPYPGWVKIVPGMPSVHINGWIDTENSVNTVDIHTIDGTTETLSELSFDDVKALYPEYLGVNYDDLVFCPEPAAYICVRGHLSVPDPDNYTEEDIYNCLASLLAEYEVQVSE